jgi:hypothetical protein
MCGAPPIPHLDLTFELCSRSRQRLRSKFFVTVELTYNSQRLVMPHSAAGSEIICQIA